jgi:hypothetical protein
MVINLRIYLQWTGYGRSNMSKGARLLGCMAAAWLLGAGVGNAAIITLGPFSGTGLSATQDDAQDVSGTVADFSALLFTSDWVEFTIAPSTLTTVTVDVLANKIGLPSFPDEMFQIAALSPVGPVVFGPTLALNIPTPVPLATGVSYFLELNSATPSGKGHSDFALSVPSGGNDLSTPIPGALVLFGTVFGAGGLLMRRRRNRGELAAAAV